MSEINERDVACRLLEDLRDRIAKLPVLEIRFDGVPVPGAEPALMRWKVLVMIDGCLERAREPEAIRHNVKP